MPDRSPQAALFASLIQDAFQFVVAIDPEFVVSFASEPVEHHLGRPAAAYLDRNVAEFVHPEDLERALLHLSGWSQFGAPGGTTSFRLQHADGRWLRFDVTAAHVTDGTVEYLAVYAQPVDYQHATDAVLAHLLQGADRATTLAPVLDVFSWQLNDSQVAITWFEPGVGHRFVSTGIPAALAGASDKPGEPWAVARATGEPVLDKDRSLLSADLVRLAVEEGRGGVWVVPVPDAGSDQPALVTVWTRDGGPRPDGHAYGMSIARTYIELILRWSNQVARLNEAAHRDPLTGLRNRTALFEELRAGTASGALLFCDLDQFKPVNDRYGHTVGDEVLCAIARRIEHSARSTDLVARTGGDEFVVLLRDASSEQAAALAQRIRAAVTDPVRVDDHLVEVGVTIGVVHTDGALTEESLEGADQALMAAKAIERGTVRWA